jgi:hypothetical protein
MAQYNDLFGFDRYARAQDMARQWDRQRQQDAMTLAQMQDEKRRNALSDRYMVEDRDQARQLSDMKQSAVTQTQGAENFAFQNMPFLQGQPEIYGEQSGVLMQDVARQYPQADLSGIYKGVEGMKPKEKKFITTPVKSGTGTTTYYHEEGTDPTTGKTIGTYAAEKKPGMTLEVGPDGTVTYSDGGAPLTKGTTANTEQDILDTNEALQRLGQIESSFKPEYLTVPYKAGQAVNAGYEKMGGTLSPAQAKSLGEYTDFRQKGMELLNEEIKRMTGAAITKQEEPRLRASMPDPQKDSPTEYKRKYDQTIKSLRLALARKNYALQKGVKLGNFPLNDMEKVINGRGQQLESQLGGKIKDRAQLQREVQLQLAREFGI